MSYVDQEELDFQNARRYVFHKLEQMYETENEIPVFKMEYFESELRDNTGFRRAIILVSSEINEHDLDDSIK